MPPFDWFNRQYSDRPKESDSKPNDSAQGEASPADEPSQETEEPAIAQDYLDWAKLAYQNIQKRQSPVTSSPQPELDTDEQSTPSEPVLDAGSERPAEVSVSPVESSAAVEAEAEVDKALKTVESETAPDERIESTHPDAKLADSPTRETTPAPPSTESAEVDTPESTELSTGESFSTAGESSQPKEASRPLWMQSDAERQERLERLKATAIQEPEPEPVSPSTDQPSTPSDVEFDENFLWSAGVLAAQGRRPDEISVEEITWLKRLRQGLGKTRRSLINQLRSIVGQGPLNQDAVMEIESVLLQADVGIEATDYIIGSLQNRLRQEALPPEEAIAYLKAILRDMLDSPYNESYSPTFAPEKDTLNIWLITGVNGAGKTTTIGKIAHLARKSDYRCLIAAADTFRAAAVEQVKIWGQRSNVDVIANPGKNTDPAAVVFDAITAAQSRKTELLLIDTAGRLQNKKNLMEELGKIRRIIDKKAPDAHIESLLVLDATLGQNGLRQAQVFAEVAKLSGVVLTKLDGTAKGGVALAVVQQMGLPIRFIGAGEGIEDLRPFSSYEFVEALLSG
ncbi:MAG TPA: signal recognition particle-docking protein FtsY [Elainellaceae cyanobacterium]